MKLVAAKCPNCGANIDVNPKLETTKCNYCNQAILINDAIEKYKLEISGSLEVKNLPQIDNITKLANRYYDNQEYEEAYQQYDQLLKLDADNTDALLRYGICKTLLNNYIDFTMEYLSKTFDNVISILKEKNEYDDKIEKYVEEILYATDVSQEATIKYYNSYSINRFDLEQVQGKLFSCLDLYEKIYIHANDDTKEKISDSILLAIKLICKEKVYKTGKGEYGNNISEKYNIDRKTRILLEQKKMHYGHVLEKIENFVNDTNVEKPSETEIISQDSSNSNESIYNKEGFIITILCITGFLVPIIGIALTWTLGKNFKQKNKIITTIVMAIWFLILINSI